MKISKAQWDRYIKLTSALKGTARKKMDAYIAQNGISDMDAVIDYAYGIATKYGEGTSAVAAEMYDGIARAQGAKVPSAEPAPTASYTDTAKAVTYAKGRGQSLIPGAVETLVKQAGADTMLRNAARDGAEFAWVPHGSETCPMCLTIASNGWRRASKKTMKGDHADHIHSSCDCEFVIRFDGKSTVEGYDPDAYRKIYEYAEGKDSKEKVNSLRKMLSGGNALTVKQWSYIINIEQNPERGLNISPEKLHRKLISFGFKPSPLNKSKTLKGLRFEGGGGFKNNYGGDGYLQYHPRTGSHHRGEYYRIARGK